LWRFDPIPGHGLLFWGCAITLSVHAPLCRTPIDGWSARRRDLYLTTQNTHNRQKSIPPVGSDTTIPARERPQSHSHWDRHFEVVTKRKWHVYCRSYLCHHHHHTTKLGAHSLILLLRALYSRSLQTLQPPKFQILQTIWSTIFYYTESRSACCYKNRWFSVLLFYSGRLKWLLCARHINVRSWDTLTHLYGPLFRRRHWLD